MPDTPSDFDPSEEHFPIFLPSKDNVSQFGNARLTQRPRPHVVNPLHGYDPHEDGIARAFTKVHEKELRFDHTRGRWYRWDGAAWREDNTKVAFAWCREQCRQFQEKSGSKATTLSKASTAAGVERMAQADQSLAVTSAIWDRDRQLLGTPDGTVDLRTGELQTASAGDFISRLTSVSPTLTPSCPIWLRFLQEATGRKGELILFLQRWAGYCLAGLTTEHALLFIYGPGGNGKSVFLSIIVGIMGEYSRTAAMETFVVSRGEQHPTDLAMLKGARLVTASETEEGRAWAESRIKLLTGGDVITARFMRQDFFEYTPEFKLMIIGNNKPVLRNVDAAAKRRFNVVPFLHEPETPDRNLEQRLRYEWPAIMRWMIDGCIDWQQNGLDRPSVVDAATADYFSEQDTVKQWIEDCCQTGERRFSETTDALFLSWTAYALANGEKPGTTKWFSQTLLRLNCEQTRDAAGVRGRRGFTHIALKLVDTSNQYQNRMGSDV